MHCTQRLLFEAGFDPNGIDGAVGRGTRAVAEKYLESNPDVELPALSRDTAGEWCFALDQKTALVGTAFELSIDFDNKLFVDGEHNLVLGNDSGAYRLEGSFGTFEYEIAGSRQPMPEADMEWPERIREVIVGGNYQYGFVAKSSGLDTAFFDKLLEEAAETYVVIFPDDDGDGVARKDIVFVGKDGVHRGIHTSTDDPEHAKSFFQAAPRGVWAAMEGVGPDEE